MKGATVGTPPGHLPHERRRPALLRFGRITGFFPCVPAALEGIYLGESLLDHFPRHTGAGSFARSGAVQDDSLVLGIVGRPVRYIPKILADCPFDLGRTRIPITGLSDVDEYEGGVAQTCFKVLFDFLDLLST